VALTPKETQVLDYLAKGYLYKEIAEVLGISYGTVHTHIEHIYKKLHVRSRSQAIAKYLTR
jgi:DNA-binding CsgD family transcriptional regulator